MIKKQLLFILFLFIISGRAFSNDQTADANLEIFSEETEKTRATDLSEEPADDSKQQLNQNQANLNSPFNTNELVLTPYLQKNPPLLVRNFYIDTIHGEVSKEKKILLILLEKKLA
ncbi:MAG: hypothetical protein MJB14_11595 [Spirochaetes bacterium]|nr:hypothetical protein [Spirochaetota bacterium]